MSTTTERPTELDRELRELDRIRANKHAYALRLQWWLDREREQLAVVERMKAETVL